MHIAGIDPGRQGYITVLDTKSCRGWTVKLRYCDNKLLDLNILDRVPRIDICYLESLRGRGGWGATVNFGLGSYFGQIAFWLKQKDIDVKPVLPHIWINYFDKRTNIKTKDRTLEAYKRLFKHLPIEPRIVKGQEAYNDNLIDSLMIAVYGYNNETSQRLKKWTFETVK